MLTIKECEIIVKKHLKLDKVQDLDFTVGFEIHADFFSLEHVNVVLEALAKFHAAGFAFEEIKSQDLKKKYRLDEEYELVYSNINLQESENKNLVSSLLENDDSDKIIEDLEGRKLLLNRYRKTLSHSNLIRENILFKNKNGVPVECKLINFKSKSYAPPLYDVLQLIFFNTSEEFRQHHLDSVISEYYVYLKKELENYRLTIEEILTVDEVKVSTYNFLPLIKLELIVQNGKKKSTVEQFREIIKWKFLSREDCYVIIKNKIGTSDYEFLSYTMTPLDQVTGFLGDYLKLQIKILCKNKEEILNFFVKLMPKSGASKGVVEESGFFSKESFIYQTLICKMHEFGIYSFDECLPSCYFTRPEEIMVFEDLSLQNFKSLPPQIPFDFDLLCLVLKKIAKFHVSLIVLEEKISEKKAEKYRLDQDYGLYLEEVYFLKDATHKGAKLMQTGARSIQDIVNLFPEIKTEQNQANFQAVWPKLEEIFFTVTHTSDRFRNVLNHGDLWTSNIMVKLDGKKATDCRFIDYQCTRYCPPAHDYLSLLYLTTDRATRMKHEDKLQKFYHENLSQILSSYKYNIEEIYSYNDFIESVNCMRPQMVIQAIAFNTFVQLTSEEISSFLTNDEVSNKVFYEDRKEYLMEMSGKSSIFRNKLKECVLDLYDLCEFMSAEL